MPSLQEACLRHAARSLLPRSGTPTAGIANVTCDREESKFDDISDQEQPSTNSTSGSLPERN